MKRTWVLVAQSGGAKLFEFSKRNLGDWSLVKEWIHPRGLRPDRELDSDRPGRSFDAIGNHRHAMSRELTASETEDRRFAKEIIDYLENERSLGRFSKLSLISGPQFLGLLREKMSRSLHAVVTDTFHKNLYSQKELQLQNFIRENYSFPSDGFSQSLWG